MVYRQELNYKQQRRIDANDQPGTRACYAQSIVAVATTNIENAPIGKRGDLILETVPLEIRPPLGIDIDAGHWVHLNRDLPGHALSGADGLTAGVIGQPHVADDVLHTGNGPGVIGDPVQFRLVESDPHQVDRADDGIDRKIHIRDFPVREHLES